LIFNSLGKVTVVVLKAIAVYPKVGFKDDATKTFGNIVTFRDLEQATVDAITLFGDKNTKNVVLEVLHRG
jgi:hypothetical protein